MDSHWDVPFGKQEDETLGITEEVLAEMLRIQVEVLADMEPCDRWILLNKFSLNEWLKGAVDG